jgi:hypothetical protein
MVRNGFSRATIESMLAPRTNPPAPTRLGIAQLYICYNRGYAIIENATIGTPLQLCKVTCNTRFPQPATLIMMNLDLASKVYRLSRSKIHKQRGTTKRFPVFPTPIPAHPAGVRFKMIIDVASCPVLGTATMVAGHLVYTCCCPAPVSRSQIKKGSPLFACDCDSDSDCDCEKRTCQVPTCTRCIIFRLE